MINAEIVTTVVLSIIGGFGLVLWAHHRDRLDEWSFVQLCGIVMGSVMFIGYSLGTTRLNFQFGTTLGAVLALGGWAIALGFFTARNRVRWFAYPVLVIRRLASRRTQGS